MLRWRRSKHLSRKIYIKETDYAEEKQVKEEEAKRQAELKEIQNRQKQY